jgi:hypothetical protein
MREELTTGVRSSILWHFPAQPRRAHFPTHDEVTLTMASDTIEQEETIEEESFADLLAKSYTDPGRLEPGQKVTARVLSISGDWVFIDTGRKGEGVSTGRNCLTPTATSP